MIVKGNTMTNDEFLEQRIGEWRRYFRGHSAVHSADITELEDHLRNQIGVLLAAGLNQDEAFLVAVKRLGSIDAISNEFAREHSERLWKQLVMSSGDTPSRGVQREAMVAVGLAIAAAAAVKLPELFGVALVDGNESFYLRNASLFVLPFLAVFFAFKRALPMWSRLWMLVAFGAAAIIMNGLPFTTGGRTETLSAIHLPIALWFCIAMAHTGGQWRSQAQRMNYVRFSGEWFIYYVLIALGGGALIGFTAFVFKAIGYNVGPAIGRWIMPCGAAGAVLIAAWLVEAKQSVIENMAPVLTALFTPLFALLLLVFVGTVIGTRSTVDVNRDVLIGFDLLLVLVLCLVLYSISARDSDAAPGSFDRLRVVLVVAALIVDAIALWAILARISEFGFSPNKTAALGLNVLLLVNLGGAAVLYTRFLSGRSSFVALERWQTTYLPVFAVWAWIVAGLFPIIFRYQ